TSGLSAHQLNPFIDNMHLALWIVAAISLAGAAVCAMRPVEAKGSGKASNAGNQAASLTA
ncbi:MAG TPA: hypothetical protein VH498_08450, partial [Candidatus Dormibacteraeota bacterium]|nr:hypothetical protein [Candidatus Dormibacteraeota bacterium]